MAIIKTNATRGCVPATVVALALLMAQADGVQAQEWEDWDVAGFAEAVNHWRDSDGPDGLVKQRNTLQIEWSRSRGPGLSVSGVLRGSYDSVYDFNDSEFGSDAGGSVTIENAGGTGIFGPERVPWGQSIINSPLPGLPGGGGFGFNLNQNPNEGLILLGDDINTGTGGNFLPGFGGVQLAYPAQPCDDDKRGCIGSYMNKDEGDLKFPEFNDKLDFIRELYVDYEHAFESGRAFNLRVGRQQVIWGRTDLFRVLDVVNPVDYSRHNIYDELEDIRIPMGILNAEYRMGGVGAFDDLNFQGLWNFEPFRPNDLGQGGQPYSILQAGNFFRAFNNCWDNGCTVANFAPAPDGSPALLATDFGPNQIGIRDADVPDDWGDTAIGGRIEGVFKGVGFSLNALSYRAQLPTLSGRNIESDNPFTAEVESQDYPYLIAFDIKFPRLFMVGGSADFYVDPIKSAFRVEMTHTQDEEFANTLNPDLYSESDVLRWVLGWDRPTFIPFLNKTRSFLFSAQVFGQHILDHEKESGPIGPRGIPDFENNYIATLLINGFYKADRIQPRVITAYDTGAKAGVVSPQFDWLLTDHWRLIAQGNFKWGEDDQQFDDNRTANPFPPFTCPPPAPGCDFNSPSLGLGGYEPLGRFQQGPIGMAQEENEYQLTIRYQF
ncbi:MAG: DUF1302 domain-containing protein [Chromatiales bacterium]|nr:DUF1302 domain-containing protein [Chromatiales bacterium]